MTTLHRIVQTGLAVGSLLLASQLANIAQAAGACAVKDELSLALHPARWSEREPHEFDDVKLVAGSFERTHIVGDVFEYAILLKVGPDDHDRIRLHRVVREKAPCKPRPKHKAVFLLHGGTVDFRVSFLPSLLSSHAPHDQSFAVFLAQRNIDVWGLTMRSLLIPIDTTDFTFMQDWNYETDIHDIAISLGIARRVRALTGSGFGKMHLIGWSNGGTLTYAYANDETRFPPRRRHVKGLVPIDTVFKFSPEDEAQRQDACTRTAAIQLRLDAGLFQIIDGRETRQAGFLAETDPRRPLPVSSTIYEPHSGATRGGCIAGGSLLS